MNIEASLHQLLSDLGGDRATVAELVRSFLDETPKLLEEGRAAVARRDAATAQRAYHTLKGSAATFGLAELAEAGRAIEQPAKQGRLPDARQVAAAEAAFAAVRDDLAAWAQKAAPGGAGRA